MNCLKYIIVIIFILTLYFSNNNAQSNSTPCITPNGESAICTPFHLCTILYDTFKDSIPPEQVLFLKNSHCGFFNATTPLVCCGTKSSYTTKLRNTPNKTISMDMRTSVNVKKLADLSSCGFQVVDRIYGGEKTGLSEFPWMALLQYRNSTGHLSFRCGGTLISSQYVLTAAHCIKSRANIGWNLIAVRLGEYNTDTDKDCVSQSKYTECNEKPVDAKIVNVTVHKNFLESANRISNDIALIRLKDPINETEFIKPICLPFSSDISKVGRRMVVAGWGSTATSWSSPVKLKVEVPIVEHNSCIQKLKLFNINSKQICAGGEAEKDSCRGDSGGPLMTTFANRSDQWYVEGIVSFGIGCGRKGLPAVYTRVTQYLDWITENVLD